MSMKFENSKAKLAENIFLATIFYLATIQAIQILRNHCTGWAGSENSLVLAIST